jgi:hypothetical protein
MKRARKPTPKEIAWARQWQWREGLRRASNVATVQSKAGGAVTKYPTHRYGFHWHDKSKAKEFKLMSTVCPFPHPTGLLAKCSWVLGNRFVVWGTLPMDTAWGDPNQLPDTIFILPDNLQRFATAVLPHIPDNHRFVIIIGDHDVTIPNQVDARFGKGYITREIWAAWMNDARIMHLFIAHLDECPTAKVSPIPVGMCPYECPGQNPDEWLSMAERLPSDISSRPLKMLECSRLHCKSAQFSLRQRVKTACVSGAWQPFSDSMSIDKGDFFSKIKGYPFLICNHGGGIDPSPKAWTAILAGVIPIMEHFPGDSIYDDLPVVFIDNWNPDQITPPKLSAWRENLLPYFTDPEKRAKVLEKLMTKYWWDKVMKTLEDGRK